MKAILYSSHQEVVRLEVSRIRELGSMAGNPNAEDLIEVTGVDGETWWCDSIEFIKEGKKR